jgi:integrase
VATRPHDPNEPSAIRTSKLKTNAQGYWEVHYSEKGRSKRQSCLTRDANEAKRWLKDWHDEIRLTLARAQQTRIPTIEELCRGYLEYIEARGRTKSNRYVLVPVRRELGFYTPDELVDDWQQEYHDKRPGISTGTLRREMNTLQAVLNWAAKKKLFDRNAMPEFEMPPSGAARTAHLERDQEQWFWDQAIAWGHRGDLPQQSREAAQRVMLFVTIALATSARRGAIYQLTWDRVDLVHKIIDFRVPGQRVSRKRKVAVPISDRLFPVLQEAAAGGPRGRVLGDITCIRRAFVAFTETIGVPWVTPHVLRHTWATLASRNGVPEVEIAAVMGDTLKTVHDNYVHYRPDYLRASINHHATQTGASP